MAIPWKIIIKMTTIIQIKQTIFLFFNVTALVLHHDHISKNYNKLKTLKEDIIDIFLKLLQNFTLYLTKKCKNSKNYIIFIIEEVIYGNNK